MKFFSLILFTTTIPFLCFSQNDTTAIDDCSVKKNGVYYAKYNKETNIYIRFHDGDTAVTTSSTNNLGDAVQFVNKRLGEEMLMGKYFTNDNTCNIRIKAKNDSKKVKMDGFISGEKIALSIVNITDNTSKEFVFKFFESSK